MSKPTETETQHPAPTPERVPLTSDELRKNRRPDEFGTHGGPAHAGKTPKPDAEGDPAPPQRT